MNYSNTKTEEVIRAPFVFWGAGAIDAAKWFDKVITHGFTEDIQILAWDSAHKFGASVKGPGFVSYRHGLVFGADVKLRQAFLTKNGKALLKIVHKSEDALQ